jgi:hypothetical protein
MWRQSWLPAVAALLLQRVSHFGLSRAVPRIAACAGPGNSSGTPNGTPDTVAGSEAATSSP